jgi:hypothetical protein
MQFTRRSLLFLSRYKLLFRQKLWRKSYSNGYRPLFVFITSRARVGGNWRSLWRT